MLSRWEEKAFESGFNYVIGIDEAGRGPVCGPVTCGAFCWINPDSIESYEWTKSITDSKAIKESDREEIYADLQACEQENTQKNFVYKVVNGTVEEIDESDILAVTLRCMAEACDAVLAELRLRALLGPNGRVKVLIDGNKIPVQLQNREEIASECIVKGDLKVFTISCASIVAKCSRDHELRQLHEQYPDYQLDVHKGYLTVAHKAALERFGPSPIHRLTFEPCRSQLLTKRFPVPPGRSMAPVERKELLKNLPKKKLAKAEKDSLLLADRHVAKRGKATSDNNTSGGALKRLWSSKPVKNKV